MSTIGRGRGRGRGEAANKTGKQKPGLNTNETREEKPGPNVNRPPANSITPKITASTPKKETAAQVIRAIFEENSKFSTAPNPNAKSIADITAGIDRMSCSEVLARIPPEMALHNTEHAFNEFCEIVCETSVSNPDFAETGAKLCNRLWEDENMHQHVRSPLLTVVQKKYSRRDDLKKENIEKLYGLCVFLCELYKLLKICGQPLKPLTAFVVQLLKDLLDTEELTMDDVFYLHRELTSIGSLIESSEKAKMEELINIIRAKVVLSNVLSPAVRCRLIQVLELRASNWTMEEAVTLSYDAMQQDLIREEQQQ